MNKDEITKKYQNLALFQIKKEEEDCKANLENINYQLSLSINDENEKSSLLKELLQKKADKADLKPAKEKYHSSVLERKQLEKSKKNLEGLIKDYSNKKFFEKRVNRICYSLSYQEKKQQEMLDSKPQAEEEERKISELKTKAETASLDSEKARQEYTQIKKAGSKQEINETKNRLSKAQKTSEALEKGIRKEKSQLIRLTKEKAHPIEESRISLTRQFSKDRNGSYPIKGTMLHLGQHIYREGTAYIILLVLFLFFGILNPSFFSGRSIYSLFTNSTISTIIVGMGIIFVMLTGGIDLSIGWIVACCGITTGYLLCGTNLPLVLILIIAVMEGFCLGLVNGLIASKLKLFPLIITLATSSIFEGLTRLIKGTRDFTALSANHPGITAISTTKLLGMPIDFWLAILAVAVVWFVLNKTKFGRDVLAVGGNKECARLSGINVDMITCVCFGLAGLFASFASIDVLAQNDAASIEALNSGLEFTCLTAAIVGGISMMGGKGNVVGMVVGILIMQVIANGMQFAGWPTNAQKIVKGLILLLAVSFDAIKNWPKVKIRVKQMKIPFKQTEEKKAQL